MPSLELDDLAALDDVAVAARGRPALLPVDAIDDSPAQPRHEFDPASLAELAASIRTHGVLQPISVRRHPDVDGRWILNFGARRLRAAQLVGLDEIRAFEDDAPDAYAQVVENEQRDALTPLELALFVAGRLRAGESQAEIARRLGKSPSYVTYATALIDAPDWLMRAYREGRCRGMRELHELRRLDAVHPDAVARWSSSGESLTRESLAGLKGELAANASSRPAPSPRPPAPATAAAASPGAQRASTDPPALPMRRSISLEAEWHSEAVTVVVDAVPNQDGDVFVRRANGSRLAVPAADLVLRRIVAR